MKWYYYQYTPPLYEERNAFYNLVAPVATLNDTVEIVRDISVQRFIDVNVTSEMYSQHNA